MKRIVPGLMLILQLMGMLTLAFNIQPVTVKAQSAAILLIPDVNVWNEVVDPCSTFTVNIELFNVNKMWGWNCTITWDWFIVDCIQVQQRDFNPKGTSLLYVIDNEYGTIPKLAASTTEEDTVTGNGIVATLTFKVKRVAVPKSLVIFGVGAGYIDYPDLVYHHMPDTLTCVEVKWLGDIADGYSNEPPPPHIVEVPDGKVDENDLWLFCQRFIEFYKGLGLDSHCDFNCDGRLDEDDLWAFCASFIDYWTPC